MSSARRADLAPLLRPIYLPTLVYAAGSSVIVPLQVILALQLGFTEAGFAAVMTVLGALAILASLGAGYLVDAVGEERAVVATTAVGVLGLLVASAAAVAQLPGARWVLVAGLVLADVVDAVWSIARQGMVAELAPPRVSGLAMNVYGACQRLGRVAGPVLAAGGLLLLPAPLVLPAAAIFITVATLLFLQPVRARRRARGQSLSSTGAPTTSGEQPGRTASDGTAAASAHGQPVPGGAVPGGAAPNRAVPRSALRALVVLGAGVIVLSALRTAKDTLLPLWAAQGVHLSDEHVALIVALCSAMELVLFWPAGLALDRIGRAPVVVTAMGMVSLGMSLAPASTSPAWLVVAASLIGLGNGVGAGIIKTLGVDIAPTTARARFLGWWQSVNSIGDLVAPALAGVLIAAGSLGGTLIAIGGLGFVGAAWMAFWTPRLVPGRRLGVTLSR